MYKIVSYAFKGNAKYFREIGELDLSGTIFELWEKHRILSYARSACVEESAPYSAYGYAVSEIAAELRNRGAL